MSAAKRAARKSPRTNLVKLRTEEPEWRKIDAGKLRRAARLALRSAQQSGDVTVLLANDLRLAELNRRFRRKSGPTNVLSFPSREKGYLGDVAIAFGIMSREAASAGKNPANHAIHLVVHGVLHLLGYDHKTAREARIMESLEAEILSQMGIADPYRSERHT